MKRYDILFILLVILLLSLPINFVFAEGFAWTERQPNAGVDSYWFDVASDATGENLVAVILNGRLYTSSDYGATWTERQPAGDFNKNWYSVASNAAGEYLVAVSYAGNIYTSSDYGATWAERQPAGKADQNWVSVASDATGKNLIASAYEGRLYTSSNYGATWAERQPAGNANQKWVSVASDATGENLVAMANNERLYTSSNYGATWTMRGVKKNWGFLASENWSDVASNATGDRLIAVAFSGRLYTSSDYGETWTERQPAGDIDENWVSVASDSTGEHLVVLSYGGRMYVSSDYGETWTENQPAGDRDYKWTASVFNTDGEILAVAIHGGKLYVGSSSDLPQEDLSVATEYKNGKINIEPKKSSYKKNESVTFTAVPDEGYIFSGWSGDLTGNENPTTVTMDKDKNIKATFTKDIKDLKKYILRIILITDNNVKKMITSLYDSGEEVVLSAGSIEGYVFSGWSGDLTGNENPTTVTMDKDKNVIINFESDQSSSASPFSFLAGLNISNIGTAIAHLLGLN